MNSDSSDQVFQFLREGIPLLLVDGRPIPTELRRLGNSAREWERRLCLSLPDLVVQNDVEQRPVNADATVVFNKAQLAKAIHEEADA